MLLGVSDESHTIERLEGLAEWTRNLAGVITVGVGLEGALVATLRSRLAESGEAAPPTLAEERPPHY